jgi:hypothetical protein
MVSDTFESSKSTFGFLNQKPLKLIAGVEKDE